MIFEFFRLFFSGSKSIRSSSQRFRSVFASKAEMLEARVLLAGDVYQNLANPIDVNNDGAGSAADALMFSLLSSRRAAGEPLEVELSSAVDLSAGETETPVLGSGTLSTGPVDLFMDVDGNGVANEEDHQAVVDALNAASGEPGDIATFHVRTTDLDGNEITSIDVGDEFLLKVFAQDTQTDDSLLDYGVFAAYLDLEYNAALATVTGDLEFASNYANGTSGDIATPGLLDEVGGFSASLAAIGQGEFEVFSLRMQADAPGGLTFTSNPADTSPANDVLVFGNFDPINTDDVLYGSTTLTINGSQDPQQDLVAFAEALGNAGVEVWTSTVDVRGDAAEQLDLFREGQNFLPINELLEVVPGAEPGDPPTIEPTQAATDAGRATPNIWVFPDGSESDGSLLTLEEISTRAGVPIPTGVSPSIVPIEDTTVLIGAPLHLSLDGYDPNGDVLTYTIAVDNTDALEATVLSGNRSIRYTNSEDGTYLGDTVFELFEGRVPRATDRMIELAQSGFYEDITYHRVINDFVIQGGDPTATGSGGSDLGDFDDQFHVDLQHVGTGLLSMAKTDDDTNDSQFFITEGPSRHLDFNHTIFGLLTEGERVRETISNVPVDGSIPVTPVSIDNALVFEDTQNAVLMLRGLESDSNNSARVIVTATDVNGNSTVESFDVSVNPDTENGAPFLEDFEDPVFDPGEPVEFKVNAIDVEGDPIQYEAFINSTDATIEVDDEGNVTASGFIGTLDAAIRVTAADDPFSRAFDDQLFTITVNTDGPTGVDLVDASDTGFRDDDDLTSLSELQFEVAGVFDGATVIVNANGTEIGRGVATGETVVVTTNTTLTGEQDIRAVVDFGDELSTESPRLTINVDQTPPETITNTAPTAASVGEEYTFDAEHDNENDIVYSLGNAPDGMTIDPDTGEIAWTPTGSQAGTQTFQILVGDEAGNTAPTDVTVNVTAGTAELSLAAVDADGNQIGAVGEGAEFFIEVYIEDQRGDPSGVEEARVNVLFDPARASITDTAGIEISDQFSISATTGSVNGAGLQGLGGVTLDRVGDERVLLATIPMTAGTAGLLEAGVTSELIAFATGGIASNANVESAGVTISVVAVGSELTANDDDFEVREDSGPHFFDVLANDVAGADSNIVEIISNQNPDQGGAATVSSDGRTIVYTPLANSDDDERFTYTIEDSQGNTSTATVTVFVEAINDPPNAPDLVFPEDLPGPPTVSEEQLEQITALLVEDSTEEVVFNFPANDIVESDEGFTLIRLGETTGQLRPIRQVVPGSNNQAVESDIVVSFGYIPPADVSGEDTITYTLQEFPISAALNPSLPTNGQTNSGEIKVRIARVNDAPVPRTDFIEATPGQTLTIPASRLTDNDSAGPREDNEQTLTIVGVGEASQGTVVLNDDGSITYTAPANASGTATFEYTVEDDGQTETVNGLELEAANDFLRATVPVTISFTEAPNNEAPRATNDSTTAVNQGQVIDIDVLRNDTDDGGSDTLTITDVTQGANGTVAIVNGQLEYTPDSTFFGTDTFTYTISDGNSTDTAQVTVRLLDPNITTNSEVSGFVFHDVDGDGVQSGDESGYASVRVRLTGMDANGIEVDRTTTTDRNGNYRFAELAEGSYEVVQIQPLILTDGGESASTAATVAGDDRISLEVADEVVVSEGNSFGDGGLSPRFLMLEMLASHRREDGFLTSVSSNGQSQFVGSTTGWDDYTSLRVEISEDGSQVTIIAVDESSQEVRATVSATDRSLVHLIGRDVDTDTTLLRIAAPASAFDLS